jgi:signal transduction histidine kinase/CheY-like chemotaxis protein
LNQFGALAKMWDVLKQNLKFRARRFEIALLIGLVLIGPIMGFTYYSLRQLDEARRVQEHSLVVREHLNDLRAAVRQYEILSLRDAPEESRGESHREIDKILNDLSDSVEADEIQTESLTEVRSAIAEFVSEPTSSHSLEVKEWILSMDSQEAEYMNEHRPAAIAFLSTASGSILIVGILSLFLSILAFMGLRRQMRSREIIEAELRVAERQATRASEMKSKFLATISHEIRTPLNGIIAMADVMRSSALPVREKRLTDVIFQSSQALLRIINDLLNFSQIEAGQVGLEVEIFSVRHLIEQTCSVLELKAQGKNLAMTYYVAEDVPERLQGDGGRLGQVLFNLIGNAIKFTQNGSIEIRISRDPSSDENVARINFTITDTGRGISSDDLATLFQPFNRLGKVGTSGEPGTGLGLSIGQSLVRQMGGEIRVESRLDQGSTFYFQLPLKFLNEVRAQDEPASFVASTPVGVIPDRSFNGVRVLVAEDNQTNQIVVQTILEQLGCLVAIAQTGLEAIETLMSRDFDIILMDCQMPVLDGYEATRRIRLQELTSGRRPIRIVAMTANAQADDRARCLASGMDDYVAKPFVTEDLIRALAGGEFVTDLKTIETSIEDLKTRLGATALARIRVAFLASLEEWPLDTKKLSNDVEFLAEVSHKLKSSSKTIGAFCFSERLERLEVLMRANTDVATLQEIASPEVRATIDVLKAEIDRDVRSLKRLFTIQPEKQPGL